MPERHAITFRSIVIAVVLMPANAVYLALSEILWLTSAATALSLFYNVVFVLLLLVAGNLIVAKLRPSWALQPGELFTVYTMLSLSSAICSIDMLEVLMPSIAYLEHFEPLEHRYDAIVDHLPTWLVVTDPTAASAYYMGQEALYQPAVFGPWLRPLFYWFLFILALCSVMGGLVLVFRAPWTQHEKLAYPVIQVPMLLADSGAALFRNRFFWIGFCSVAALDLMNGLHFLHPACPGIPIVRIVNLQALFGGRPWSDMGPTFVSLYPFAIALCFFMPLDLAFSCWFFYLLFKMQRVAASHFGVHGMPGFPYIAEQTCGGYYALALLALWMTRRHLKRFFLLASGSRIQGEKPGERAEARIAVLLIMIGGAFLLGFSLCGQMTPWIVVLFFASYFLISVAITRMRAELGYPSHDLHEIGPHRQIVNLLGASNMARTRPHDLTMFGLYHFITRAYRSHPMPHALEALRISERSGMDSRRYLAAMALAVIVGTLVSFWALLWVFTTYGASNISGVGEYLGRETWDLVNVWFIAPERHLPHRSYAILIGTLLSLGLASLRMNLAWWPFHPVGYAVSGSWSMEQLWACFLAAWLIKAAILRYGGAKVYRRAIPLFVGLMLGDFFVGNLWTIFGMVTEQDVYHFWPY